MVGAGPAGSGGLLSGHRGLCVEVFESLPVAGGWLAVGIPEYRLPKDVLNAEIKVIEDTGVKIHLGNRREDIPFAQLQRDSTPSSSAAARSTAAAQHPRRGHAGVIHGVDYLKRVNLGEKVFLGDKVAVVGGGNVAMDAVRTAVRTGSKEVFILYRRSRAEMPASPEEIEEALEEGIKMEFLAAPKRVVGENGKVTGVECTRMERGEPDASGRRRPVEIKGSEFIVPCDALIPAIGQEADLEFVPAESGIAINKWRNFDVDPVTFATNVPGVFAGGDVVTGPATVVKAVYAGKEAAVSIDRYLRGEDVKAGRERDWSKGLADPGDTSAFAKAERVRMPMLPAETRKSHFREVVEPMAEAQAVAANRCLLRTARSATSV